MPSLPLTVSARLFLSFLAAVGFTVLASMVAVQSFDQVRRSLQSITGAHQPAMVAAFELAREAEAAVASAPAVAAATVQSQRQTAYYRLSDQITTLDRLITDLEGLDAAAPETLSAIRASKQDLAVAFDRLNRVVERRIWNEQARSVFLNELGTLRASVMASLETVVGPEHARTHAAADDAAAALDLLIEASVAVHPHDLRALDDRFHVLVDRALATLDGTSGAAGRAMIAAVREIQRFGAGPRNLFLLRRDELEARRDVDGLLAHYSGVSAKLGFAVNDLIRDQRASIEAAATGSTRLLDRQSTVLAGLVLLCIVGAVAIAAYVSRSILRRLGALEKAMVAGARGEEVRIDTSGVDEIASMGRALDVFTNARDAAERELRQAKESAELANRAKTRFLAAASHDLRQPLQALSLFAGALGNRTLDAESRAIVDRIEGSVDALGGLLESLLDISKLDAGIVVPDRGRFVAAELLRRLAREFEPLAAEKGITLSVARSSLSVYSDPALLDRILRNLLANAIRYTPERGRVLMGCRRSGNGVRIEVLDNGPGIPEGQLDEIFREFHQLDNPARVRAKGLGLGLAIVERTARLLGHPIGVRSVEGRGAAFHVTVPRDGPATIDPVAPVPPADGSLTGLDVLVLDDDQEVRAAMTTLFAAWGAEVRAVSSLAEALERLDRTPDLIIADFRLEGDARGDDAVKRLRDWAGTMVPAVLVTGDTAPERLREARASGLPLLHKPVAPARLFDMLASLLGRRGGSTTP